MGLESNYAFLVAIVGGLAAIGFVFYRELLEDHPPTSGRRPVAVNDNKARLARQDLPQRSNRFRPAHPVQGEPRPSSYRAHLSLTSK